MSTGSENPFGQQPEYPPNPYAAPTAVDEIGQREPTRTGELTLNPWLSIWTRPKETIRQIVDSNPTHQIPLLACLGGIASSMGQNQSLINGDISIGVFFAIVVVLGPVAGFLMLYLYAAIIGLCCRLLNGVAEGPEMRAAIAWSWVPTICLLPVSIGMNLYLVSAAQGAAEPAFGPVILVGGLLGSVFGIWSFVIALNTIAEVNLFSRWKAFFAMMIPGLVIFAAIFAVVLLLIAINGPAAFAP